LELFGRTVGHTDLDRHPEKGIEKPLGEPWDDVLKLERPRMAFRAMTGISQKGGLQKAVWGPWQDFYFAEAPLEEAFGHKFSIQNQRADASHNVIKLRTALKLNPQNTC